MATAVTNILIVNPLKFALAHYQREISSVMNTMNINLTYSQESEPSQSNRSRFSWIFMNFFKVNRASKKVDHIVTLWPIMGYLDLLIYPLIAGRTPITWIMHDPKPLTKAIGYGKTSRLLASILSKKTKISIVVHTKEALSFFPSTLHKSIYLLPHPILTNSSNQLESSRQRTSCIRVLGQYKEDRDVSVLRKISAFEQNAMYEIFGRNWPEIEGWQVHPNFLSEDEFTRIIRSSFLVLIPYRFFFQSGIAIRCLEERIPFMISKNNFSENLVGKELNFLLIGEIEAKINNFLQFDYTLALDSMYINYRDKTVRAWSVHFAP